MINVFNIEKFATHDGPGIRTTVFLKGCSLHCPWCANPESWSKKPTLLYDQRKCVSCKACAASCTTQAITFDQKWQWDSAKCFECRQCTQNCLPHALSFAGETMSVDAVVNEVLKDKDYFDNSDGGITVSGGEPFLQADALAELLKECKCHDLHVAVETTGNVPLSDIKKALPYIDLFLYDVKHLNADTLYEVTGGRSEYIFTNLEWLAQRDPAKVIVRVPVIPGFNANQEMLCKIIDYAKKLKVREVNLLPYHSLGKNKWEQMNRDYVYKDLKIMEKCELSEYAEYGKRQNIKVKIGG